MNDNVRRKNFLQLAQNVNEEMVVLRRRLRRLKRGGNKWIELTQELRNLDKRFDDLLGKAA